MGSASRKSSAFFLQEKVEYLGHVVDSRGIRPAEEKTWALIEAPRPGNDSELTSS